MKKLLILAAVLAAPLAPLAAHAAPAQGQQIQVSTAGLDLTNPADAAVMIDRIEAAVRPMCVVPGFAAGRSTAGCIREVTKEAVKNMRVPELSLALKRPAKSGRPVANG